MLCYMMMILRCILFDFELIICFGVTLCDEGLLLYIYIYIYNFSDNLEMICQNKLIPKYSISMHES